MEFKNGDLVVHKLHWEKMIVLGMEKSKILVRRHMPLDNVFGEYEFFEFELEKIDATDR